MKRFIFSVLCVLLAGLTVYAQDLPKPKPVDQTDMILKVGQQALVMDAQSRYIVDLEKAVHDKQTEIDELKKKLDPPKDGEKKPEKPGAQP